MMMLNTALRRIAWPLLMLLPGCGMFGEQSYSFKMTVDLKTNEGPVSASRVYKVSARKRFAILPDESKQELSLTGQAICFPDIGGADLYVLLDVGRTEEGDLAHLSLWTLDELFSGNFVESAKRISSRPGESEPVEVQPDQWPVITFFENPRDFRTIKMPDDKRLFSIGHQQVEVERISISKTDAPVTPRDDACQLSSGPGKKYGNWVSSLFYSDPRGRMQSSFIRS